MHKEKNQLLLKMWENKIGQQKSTCFVCGSKKPTFSKPIKPIKLVESKNSFNKSERHADLLFKM